MARIGPCIEEGEPSSCGGAPMPWSRVVYTSMSRPCVYTRIPKLAIIRARSSEDIDSSGILKGLGRKLENLYVISI